MTSPVGNDRRGFTFVEIILVLLLIGVSLALVLPNIDKGLQDREVRNSALGLAAVARDLRSRAVMQGAPQQLVVLLQRNSYLIDRRQVELPLNVMFASIEGGETINRDTTKFYFFPNGSSLGGEIVLADRGGRMAYAVQVEALTGRIAVSRR